MSALTQENAQTPYKNDTSLPEVLSTDDFVVYVNFLKQFMRNIPNGSTGIYKDGDYVRISYLGEEYFTFLHLENGEEEFKHVMDQ